ncbi:MAG: FkbM family methyltransferase [Actinomycetota bacterium]
MEIGAVLRWLVGAKGIVQSLEIVDRDERILCQVPDDDFWGAVADIVLLDVYANGPISLDVRRHLVVDAGAHVGLFSLTANSDHVVAFEPHATNFRVLRNNIEANPDHDIKIVQKALWNNQGKALFFHGTHSGGGSLIPKERSTRSVVKTTSLDEVIEEYGAIDLLKLDVEGAECEIVMAASGKTLESISAITSELHPECEERLIRDRLEQAGFRVTVLEGTFHYPRETLRRLVKNRHRLTGCHRLKMGVLLIHIIGYLAVTCFPVVERPRLRFLYATRPEASFQG